MPDAWLPAFLRHCLPSSSAAVPWTLTFLCGATVATTGWMLASATWHGWAPPLFVAMFRGPAVEPVVPRVPAATDDGVDEAQTLLTVLYGIAEEQAKKEGFVHRGITCNHCGTSPIRGLRYKCCNCADFDLCETCESQAAHTSTHLFLKVRIPIPPLANPRSTLLTIQYPGNPDAHDRLPPAELHTLQSETHFDPIELEALYEEYTSLAPTPRGIPKPIFEHCLGALGQEKNLIAERMWVFFDADGDTFVDFRELAHGLSVLCKGNVDEKARYAFHGYDVNGDGRIDQDELHAMFKAYFHLSMELVRDIVKALEEEMMDSFDDENTKPVSAMFTAPIPASSSSSTVRLAPPPVPKHSGAEAGAWERGGTEEADAEPLAQGRGDADDAEAHAHTHDGHDKDDALVVQGGEKESDRHGFLEVTPTTPRYKPIMEQMSQDAIAEMVQKTFQSMDVHQKGYIEFPEFKAYVENDSTLISWFETLGSVF